MTVSEWYPDLNRAEISNEGDMADLCDEFFALDRFVRQLERLAAGIRSGAIEVPS